MKRKPDFSWTEVTRNMNEKYRRPCPNPSGKGHCVGFATMGDSLCWKCFASPRMIGKSVKYRVSNAPKIEKKKLSLKQFKKNIRKQKLKLYGN